MYKGKRICVVVPAYNQERLVGRVIETIPEYVDQIAVVDDGSSDATADVVAGYQISLAGRLVLLRHSSNQGVGAARVTGYKWSRERGFDAVVSMDADGQMDPADLGVLLDPVVEGRADYAKGNRLSSGDAWKTIPRVRYLGNAALSLLTKIASGYWHVADSQTGYTAINLRMLEAVDWDRTYRRYGCPNDYLVRLNVCNARVRDVPVKPVYRTGERSGIRYRKVIPRLSWLLLRLFVWRLVQKYVIRDFHPLVFFYLAGFLSGVVSAALLVRLVLSWATQGHVPQMTALALGFFAVMSIQFTCFAMWFDMEANRDLRG
jgi:glycosyltransferase involved in cell wall biosynthesis